jgi:hypothetical protein
MKFYSIRISKQADQDIENLHHFIFEKCKSPITSKKHIEGLYSYMISLSRSAESFPISTHKSVCQYGMNTRRINYKKMTIIFTIHGANVLIRRIISGSLIKGL